MYRFETEEFKRLSRLTCDFYKLSQELLEVVSISGHRYDNESIKRKFTLINFASHIEDIESKKQP